MKEMARIFHNEIQKRIGSAPGCRLPHQIRFVYIFIVKSAGRKTDMKSLKLKQFAVSLLAITAFFVSAISACTCSHHQAKQETESASCHEHSAKTVRSRAGDLPETIETSISEAGCVCFQSARKAFAKSENVKFEKHAATISPLTPPAIVFIPQNARAKIDFTKPFHLSDSFYNFSHGRAPPVL